MRNRIPDYLPVAQRAGWPSRGTFPGLRHWAQQQITGRTRQVTKLVQEHPVTGIGVACCLGILLGWVIKRR